MDTIKKIGASILFLIVSISVLSAPITTYAAQDFENQAKWSKKCESFGAEDRQDCLAYKQYLRDKGLSDINKELENLKSSVSELSGNLQKDEQTLVEINKRVEELDKEIAQSKQEIAALESKIVKLEKEIAARILEIEEKEAIAKNYMVNIQSSTRLNVFVDFLLGGEDFAEISRRVEGMNRINDKNQKNIRELNEEKIKLEENKKDLDFEKAYLDDVLASQEETARQQKELQKVAKERIRVLRIQYQDMIEARNAVQQQKELIVERINSIAPVVDSQGGMLRPIGSGFQVSASVWSYSSGHKHLGIDLAAPVGTSIVAPANGIVIATYTGCGTYGGLNNSCGSGYGNYILMIVRDSGNTYGALYGHMQSGGVHVGVGQNVSKGQVIGKVGSSGTSTGPHVHAELFYLGTDSVEDTYNNWYGGSRNIQFGLGGSSWGNEYGNRCDVKGMSPDCRMNPSNYWGLYVGDSY